MHGIFEGGTVGNLFTSFFVADYRGVRTLMARNGGILNGIYRTSYFLLSEIDEGRYRFVDALGGADIMWMDLTFRGDELEFVSYTSRLGLRSPPNRHMRFVGRRMHAELAESAAKAVGFPENEVYWDLPDGLPIPDWGEQGPVTSASYLWEDGGQDLVRLGELAGDPCRVDQIAHLSMLSLEVTRNATTEGVKLLVYLSREALTDSEGTLLTEFGFLREDVGNGILMFPEIAPSQDRFTFTYLHPGTYFLTVVADLDGDGFPSSNDAASPSRPITVEKESHRQLVVDDLRPPS